MDAIIFSKDRPMQLDCLLRSIRDNCDHFKRVYVLMAFPYFDKPMERGYDMVMDRHKMPGDWFIVEHEFKHDFLALVSDCDYRVALFCDDDIIHRPVHIQELVELAAEVDIISLRLGNDKTVKKHFDYKGSLDGHIYARDTLLKLAGDNFTNPNQLEVKMQKHCTGTMGWFNESKLIGIPANRVSDGSHCDFFGLSTEALNELWLSGYEIDYKAMNLESGNVHKNEWYKFRERERK